MGLPKKLVIDRATWLRGTGEGQLLDGNGCKCCLGFLALALGYGEDEILHIGRPDELADDESMIAERFGELVRVVEPVDMYAGSVSGTAVCNSLITENDAEGTPDAEREQRIAALFAGLGVEVEFVNVGSP